MELRKNRVKVFFSENDLTNVDNFIMNNVHLNVSFVARIKLRKRYETQDMKLTNEKAEGLKNKEMIILFNNDEKNLIHELSEYNNMSQSEVVRALVIEFIKGI